MALAVTTLGACGNTSPQSKNITLHVVATDYSGLKTASPVAQTWNSLARSFEERNPNITIDVQFVPVADADAQVATMVADGRAPDLAQLDSFSAFTDDKQLYSADELFPISMESAFVPSLTDAGSVNHVQYGIPWVASTRMFFYNKKLFARAGITRAPETWADIRRDAVKLKEHGVPVPYGLPLGPQEAEAETMMWMIGNDGGYTDNVGSYNLDSVRNVDAFVWLRKNLVDAGLVGPKDPAKTSVSDAFSDFLAGRTGMLNGHLTLLPSAKAAGIDIGVAPLPGRTGPSSQALGNADWMMAFRQKGHREADAKFLQYIYSEANLLKFQQEYKLLPVTVKVAETVRMDPQYRDLVPFMNLLSDAAFYPVAKASWAPVSAELKKDIGQAVHRDPKAVLAGLQRDAQRSDGVR
ncbi:extracellular solute-binding protein [Streptomyces sp. CBMA29]|uniref:extracellular solute-binding protein n=1 Tax=Streptomyces sp. CBMA29 TaxID=1896314 RepID=UPI001661D912|nr:extracellular solute-binding protein [Streptomyces sp. CBMA29]